MLEVPLLGVGTVLRFERGAWSMLKRPRQATNEHAPPQYTLHSYTDMPVPLDHFEVHEHNPK